MFEATKVKECEIQAKKIAKNAAATVEESQGFKTGAIGSLIFTLRRHRVENGNDHAPGGPMGEKSSQNTSSIRVVATPMSPIT